MKCRSRSRSQRLARLVAQGFGPGDRGRAGHFEHRYRDQRQQRHVMDRIADRGIGTRHADARPHKPDAAGAILVGHAGKLVARGRSRHGSRGHRVRSGEGHICNSDTGSAMPVASQSGVQLWRMLSLCLNGRRDPLCCAHLGFCFCSAITPFSPCVKGRIHPIIHERNSSSDFILGTKRSLTQRFGHYLLVLLFVKLRKIIKGTHCDVDTAQQCY